jgi:hypothetical protein
VSDKQSQPEDIASTVSAVDKLLFSIRTMSIEDFKTVDPSLYSADEKITIRKAMESRKREITATQQSNVVAEVVPEKVVEEKPINWEKSIRECGDKESFDALMREMPESVQIELGDLLDEQLDLLR